MRKGFQKCLLLLPMLMAILGFPQTAKAQECFQQITADPPIGSTITDLNDLSTITLTAPDGYKFSSKALSPKIYLYSGETKLAEYKSAFVKVDGVDTQMTLSAKAAITGTATPGELRVVCTKGGFSNMYDISNSTSVPMTEDFVFTYQYGASAGSVIGTLSISQGTIITEDDFAGISVSFEGATKVELNDDFTTDDCSWLMNDVEKNSVVQVGGKDFTLWNLSRGNVVSGLVEFTINAGCYNVTLEDGSIVPSPKLSTYFYVGEVDASVTPAENANVNFDDFTNYSVSFPAEWTAALGDKSIRNNVSFIEIGSEKLFVGSQVFTADTDILTWEPTLDGIKITEDTKATVFMPKGMYNLTFNGKVFKSSELTWSFTLVAPQQEVPVTVTATTTPAAGAIVNGKLSEFSVAFACAEQEITAMTINENAAARAMVTFAYGEDEGYSLGYGLTDGDNGLFKLDIPFAPTENTEVTISLREGAFILTLADGRTVDSPAVDATFTVSPEASAGPVVLNWTSTPANGAELNDFSGDDWIKFEFSGYDDLSYFEPDDSKSLTIILNGESQKVTTNIRNTWVRVKDLASYEGEWHVTVEEGYYVYLDEDDNEVAISPAIDLTFTVIGAPEDPEIAYTTVPEQGAQLDELESFQVIFTDAKADFDWENLTENVVTMKYGDTTLCYGSGLSDDPDDPTKILLDFPFKPTTPTLVTVNFAEGAYLVTVDGKEIASPAIEFSFTVGNEAPEPVEVKYTTTPVQDAVVDSIEGFSVNFEGVKEIAWASDSEMPDITLKCGETTLSYFNGFVEGDDINEFVLDKVLSPDTPTLCTVTFAAGVYNLTLEDGTEQPSEAIEFSFTVGCEKAVEVAYTTTPAQDSSVDELESFSVNFEGVKEIAWASEDVLPDVTVKCGDTTLSYTNGFFEGDEINEFVLDDVLSPDTPTLCTVAIAAGVYTLTLEDGTTTPSPAVEFSFTVGKQAPLGDDVWVPLTSLDQLNGAEVALVWYYDGVKAGLASAPAKIADRVTNGIESCIVMSTADDPVVAAGKLYSNDFLADAVEAGDVVTEATEGKHKQIVGIRTMPESAAIMKAEKTAEGGYSFQFTNYTPDASIVKALGLNLDNPIYMFPQEDLGIGRNSCQPSNTPGNNTVSINANGAARITSTERSDRDLFSASITTVGGKSVADFVYMEQILDQGNLFFFVKKSEVANDIVVVADPVNDSTIEGTKGTESFQFSFANVESAVANDKAELTATFNGEPVDVVWDKQYPANVTVTLAENAEGVFVLNIPAGWYSVDVNGDEFETPAYIYTINFKSALKVAKDLDVAITPENGSTVANVSDIEVIFPENVKSVQLNEDVAYTGISATLGGQVYSTPMMRDETHFTYRPEVLAQNITEFTFTLAEGFYILTLDNGTQALSPEISTTVTIDPNAGAVDVAYTTTPADGSTVNEFTEVSVLFEDVEEVAFGAAASPDGFTITCGDEVLKYGYDFEEGAGINDPITTMILNEAFRPDKDTEVTVNIAAGFYQLTLVDGTVTPSPAVEFSFKVLIPSGVDFNLSDDASNDVYTTTGVCVLRNATKADMDTLSPGLYIVNGRVIIKK